MNEQDTFGRTTNTCTPCNREFKTKDALNDHNKDKHGIKKPRMEDSDRFTEADYQTWMRL